MRLITLLPTVLIVLFGIPLSLPAVETPENIGPEIITLKMGGNPLSFKHREHQKRNSNECFHCHKPQEWKIKEWDKEVAHQICIACHDMNDKGPVECKECHKSK